MPACLVGAGWKQAALSAFAAAKLKGHVEAEQLACGSGIELIYEFLFSDEACNRPQLLLAKGAGPKGNKDITQAALDGSDPLAVETVDLFLAIVAAEAGHMALRCLAAGGVYIAGGITPRLLQRVQLGGFMQAFINPKNRAPFPQLLSRIPVYVITNTNVGMIGCREFALTRLLS